ncbi:Hypothetical protein A7982_03972 [Minicystis rosea]|nr:Hypothetical protein A7982_03972 [Minicystis rosea]
MDRLDGSHGAFPRGRSALAALVAAAFCTSVSGGTETGALFVSSPVPGSSPGRGCGVESPDGNGGARRCPGWPAAMTTSAASARSAVC